MITFLLFAIIGFLYFASEVLRPLALAILLAFAMVPISKMMERRGIPRVPATVITVVLVLGTLGFIGYQVGQNLNHLAEDLPKYQSRIEEKAKSLKPGRANTITNVANFVKNIGRILSPRGAEQGADSDASEAALEPMKTIPKVQVVQEEDFGGGLLELAGPYVEALGTASIILILVIFLMIHREDMGDRLIRLFGRGRISLTTRTLGEVGQRISRYLAMFAAVNTMFGTVIGLSLWALGLPYPILWGFLAGSLRFIPYVGAATAFILPVIFSFASTDGYGTTIGIVVVFGVLEVLANAVLEPIIYGKSTGVSALALLVSAMFWTWLWGGLGLLLSTPLTVCLAVLGKYVPSLKFFATFLHEEVDLDPGVRFYQRLLATDQDGATGVVDESLKLHTRADVFDKVLVPTLSMAERDYASGDIDEREQAFIHRVIADILDDLMEEPEVSLAILAKVDACQVETGPAGGAAKAEEDSPCPSILALPANDATDVLVLRMLAVLLVPSGLKLEIADTVESPLKTVDRVEQEDPSFVLISHLPPDGLTAACYLTRRLRARFARLPILVGRWGVSGDDDAGSVKISAAAERLAGVGATTIFSDLSEARDRIIELAKGKAGEATATPVGTSVKG
ncbi:AI-2E family transporter [Tundrisphaera sp. TA3]|uniref:AI-2E family transporter n=1 Tax=Tundrisphaera sp. TA3 TaxID=3435775 RepID=UPI003EBCD2E9